MKWNGLHVATWVGAGLGGCAAAVALFWRWLAPGPHGGLSGLGMALFGLAEIAWASAAGLTAFAVAFTVVLAVGYYAEQARINRAGLVQGLVLMVAGVSCTIYPAALEAGIVASTASVGVVGAYVFVSTHDAADGQDQQILEARRGSLVMLVLAFVLAALLSIAWFVPVWATGSPGSSPSRGGTGTAGAGGAGGGAPTLSREFE